MRKLIIILLFIIIMIHGYARNDWYESPIELEPGLTLIDTLKPNAESVHIHARLQRKNKKPTAWELQWNQNNDGNYNMAIVNLPDQRAFDDIYVPDGLVEVYEVRDNEAILLEEVNFPVDDPSVSLKLVYDGVSARLYAGTKDRTLIGQVPYNASKGGGVVVSLQCSMRAIRLTAESQSYPLPNYIEWEKSNTYNYSVIPIIGEWKYLDRDINQSLASLGGKYDLFIVPGEENSYYIMVDDGANVNREAWSEDRIKGLLSPSGFRGNYDLIWYDALGRRLDDDNNAQLSDDGAVLTLYFPVYKSQIRFKKIHP